MNSRRQESRTRLVDERDGYNKCPAPRGLHQHGLAPPDEAREITLPQFDHQPISADREGMLRSSQATAMKLTERSATPGYEVAGDRSFFTFGTVGRLSVATSNDALMRWRVAHRLTARRCRQPGECRRRWTRSLFEASDRDISIQAIRRRCQRPARVVNAMVPSIMNVPARGRFHGPRKRRRRPRSPSARVVTFARSRGVGRRRCWDRQPQMSAPLPQISRWTLSQSLVGYSFSHRFRRRSTCSMP